MTQSIKLKINALILLLVIGGFTALCVAVYAKAFTATVPVYLRADRSGLQMYEGNRVQLQGVDVGEVGDVALADDERSVDITLDMKPDLISEIPQNVGVTLDQLTAFGAKTVALTPPTVPSDSSLRPASTLMTDRVTVEVNTLFDHLGRVLDTLQPARVNTFLGAMATALNGRGDDIGKTVEEADAYLRRFNQNLPDLQRTMSSGADLANLYADAAPGITEVLGNASVTSKTLVEQQIQLDTFLTNVTGLSGVGGDFFRQNGDGLAEVVSTARPTTDLLRTYSPEFACFLQGLDEGRKRTETAQGNGVAGVHGITSVEPGDKPYGLDEKPVMGVHAGPQCYGMPGLDGHALPDSTLQVHDLGSRPGRFDRENKLNVNDPPLVAQLFGPLAAAPLQDEDGREPQGQTDTDQGEGADDEPE